MERGRFVFHIADVHVRLYQRHKEYREVFRKTCQEIRERFQPGDLILIAGDINHSKLEITNEASLLIGELFIMLSDIGDVLIIPGNHDFNMSNPDRLDSIYPVVKNINRGNLIYFRDTGVFEYGDMAFYHFSLFSDKSEWDSIEPVKSPHIKTHIALYHGVVAGATTPQGFDDFAHAVPVTMFDRFDITMLGDIHKFQFLNSQNTIAYPGSLIQQDHGEDLEHGFIVWDIDSRRAEFITIPNDYAYVTLNPVNGIPENLPKHARIRVIHDADEAEVKLFVDSVKAKYELEELKIERQSVTSEKRAIDIDDILNSRNYDVQLKLIREYLGDVDENLWEQIIEIHKSVSGLIRNVDTSGIGVRWKPIKFTFSNMFSYGPDNVIDFKDIRGIVGLFAPNASGKSTLLDSIVYCIFDKCSRTNRAAHVLNNSSNEFSCELEFMIQDSTYVISRKGIKKSDGTVKVDVNFDRIEVDKRVSLNGTRRDDTNKIIRDYLGTYDDFVLTTLSTQADNRTFIDMTKKERQELLYRFLDIHVFVECFNAAREASRGVDAEVKVYGQENFVEKEQELDTRISESAASLERLSNDMTELESAIKSVDDEVDMLRGKLYPIDTSLNISMIQVEIERKAEELKSKRSLIIGRDEERNRISETVNRLESKYADLCEKQVSQDDVTRIQADIDRVLKIDRELSHLQSKVDVLKTHEYDPNCKYCVRNPFVVDAENAKSEIVLLTTERTNILGTNTIETLRAFKELATVMAKDFNETFSNLNMARTQLKNFNRETELMGDTLRLHEEAIQSLNEKMEKAKLQQQHKLANDKINEQIALLRSGLPAYTQRLQECKTQMIQFSAIIKSADTDKKNLLERKAKYEQTVQKKIAFDTYMNAVNRNGIPYMILRKVLPIIESEVNEILNGIVDFSFRIEIGENDEIDGSIVYGDRTWAIELSSGMERFILSLAIRCSLIRLSNLPKPNFLAIDEGFGVLDSDKLHSIKLFFEFLKSTFDFVLCISHISEMRDYVDQLISINKTNGFSKIQVT